jgi:hypothetical protein
VQLSGFRSDDELIQVVHQTVVMPGVATEHYPSTSGVYCILPQLLLPVFPQWQVVLASLQPALIGLHVRLRSAVVGPSRLRFALRDPHRSLNLVS